MPFDSRAFFDKQRLDAMERATGHLDLDVGSSVMGSNIAEGVGAPLGKAIIGAVKGVGNTAAAGAKAVGRGAKNFVSNTTPKSVQRRLGKQVPYDLGDVKDRASVFRNLGVAKDDLPDSLKYQLKRKSLFPGSKTLGFGLAHGLPALAESSASTKGTYDRLSAAADPISKGVREVTASTNRLFEIYNEKVASRPQGLTVPLIETGGKIIGSGIGEVGKPTGAILGRRLSKWIAPSAFERAGGVDTMMESGLKEFGKQTGMQGATFMSGMMNNAITGGQDAVMYGAKRKRIYQSLMSTDPVISRADPEAVLEAYHTMKKFAPMLSTDPTAVKAFLREAVVHEGSINYNTLGALAKAETEAKRALAPV